MKLFEVFADQRPMFAWLEPKRGPNDVLGVQLHYIEPIHTHFERVISAAERDEDQRRVERLTAEYQRYMKGGQRFFTPSLGWWMSEEDFDAGREGFDGMTKAKIMNKYPKLRVAGSRREAVDLADREGVLEPTSAP